jgi:glucose-1-phosphate thymidylyltransferase
MNDEARPSVIGIVPAAGRATRLPNREGSKELIHVGDRAIADYLIESMIDAGATRLCIVIAPGKQDILEHFGDRAANGVPISYVYQTEPTGMSDAIDLSHAHLRGATVLMGMPDTIVNPPDSLARAHDELRRSGADIVLAIAPTDEPHRLGPVIFDSSGDVQEILDKPQLPPHDLVWTVACWNARVTEFLHDRLAAPRRPGDEAPLGLIFQDALEHGFRVRAVPFAGGRYIDAGTERGLAAARAFVTGEAIGCAQGRLTLET